MTTAAAARREMVEQHDSILRWDTSGLQIEGHLLDVRETMIVDKDSGEEKAVTVYIMRDPENRVLQFTQTVQLQRKLTKDAIGHYFTVTFIAEKPLRDGGNVKLFRVFVSREKELNAAQCHITDEDIPF